MGDHPPIGPCRHAVWNGCAMVCHDWSMGLEVVGCRTFLEAVSWACDRGWRVVVRRIRYRSVDGVREPVIGPWYPLLVRGGRLLWRDVEESQITAKQEMSVAVVPTMRLRLDRLAGKADVRDGGGLYLQIRMEVPDSL